MRVFKMVAIFVMQFVLFGCGSDSGDLAANLQPVTQSIAYNYVTPGNSLPDIMYNESITISGTTMTVTRNGGVKVNSGMWTIVLKQDELTNINDLLALTIKPDVKDYVNDNMVYDAPSSNLFIGNAKEFHYEMVVDPITNKNQWHQFPIEATNLVSNLEKLMIAHIGDRYKQ